VTDGEKLIRKLYATPSHVSALIGRRHKVNPFMANCFCTFIIQKYIVNNTGYVFKITIWHFQLLHLQLLHKVL
jgi:hypothetical protein